MAFLIIILPLIWLLTSVIVKLAESTSIASDNSYSFSNGGRTCSIRNGKLFVDDVFKRELTAPEMEEVERWSEAFNQVIRRHGHGHMHNGWHDHDSHGSHNRLHNHDHHHHDHSGHGDYSGHGHEYANYDKRWPSSHVHHGEGSKHRHNYEHGQHNEENSRRQGYHNHGNGQEYYYIHGNYARKKRQNIPYSHSHGSGETQLNRAAGDGGWHGKRDMNNDDQVVLFHGLSPTTHFPHVCDFV